jgi:hypothetical protein
VFIFFKLLFFSFQKIWTGEDAEKLREINHTPAFDEYGLGILEDDIRSLSQLMKNSAHKVRVETHTFVITVILKLSLFFIRKFSQNRGKFVRCSCRSLSDGPP